MGLEILAGTPRGGGQDRTARALASVLAEKTTISNVSGRGGGNAWDLLARRVGSSHLAAVSSPTLITNVLMGEADVDHRGLTPLAMFYTEPSALVVRSGSALEEPSALLEALAGGAARVAFATARGNMNHLGLAEIAAHLGAPVTTMPIRVFESAPQALADVVGGGADMGMVSTISAVPGMGDGNLTPVLVTAPDRIGGGFEEVPTCLELAVPCVR
ncbi:MAG: tripartite tricarboxylate transporter substrate-binding protein, partial [Acidimicrobiia bacterium]